ncbi:unnamed protein product [Mytilus edulis]|uniref:Endonuclease/exonuclease/phosphatase domain-containing protein n=1 Tax=Mytilus edulis TaxID=6550 RepID=A0A8S3RAW3_MYTED|nr:unnamed protein product [Mytilus edulis]
MTTRKGSITGPKSSQKLNQDEEEAWTCAKCTKIFKEPEAQLMECQRCKEHFCISCLKKTKAEYSMLCKTDAMWFCGKCRIVMEQHAVTDIEIEKRCKQIMESYEERITSLEKTVENKCDEDKVKQIVCEEIKSCNEEMVKIMVKEEVSKIEAPITEEGCDEDKVKAIITEEISKIQKPDNKGDSDSTNNEIDKAAKNITRKETVTNVLEEINERKSRENNLIIFGIPEIDEESKEVRENTDKERLNELFKDCKIQLDKENLKTIKRLGKFNREKLNRPILVKLPSAEPKITLFRNIHYIKTNPKYAKVGVSNDLTQAEREQEKRLWDQAKKQTEEEISGDYHFRVFKNVKTDNFTVLPKLSCIYTNADQLFNKLPELTVRTRDDKPKIIGITEVKPKNNRYKPGISEYSLAEVSDYNMFGKNLDVDTGRGLLLYIDKQLDASQVHMNTEFQENLFIKINLNQSDQLLLGLIYRSPSNRSQEYTKQLNLLTTEACNKGYSHILIMGDYNYPEINWDSWNSPGDSTESNEYRFLENLQENFLFQHVTRPTRWRGTNTPHTLDLILTNEENMVSNLEYQSPLGKSDHCTMKFDFNCYTNIKSKPKLIKLFSKGNYIKIKEELNKIKWPELLQKENDINENWKSVLSIIQDMDKKYIPTKERKQIGRGKNNFPMDKNTIDKIKRKNILSKKITHNNDPEVRKEYNKIRNQVKSRVNKLKREYEKNLSEKAKENPKAIWSYIKSKTKTKEGIGDLHLDPEDTKSDKTEDNSKKAKLLVEYFSSVFTKEPDGKVPSPTPVLVTNDMPYQKIKEEVVLRHLNALKIDKSPGMDKLHPRLLKEIAESLAKPLCIIYNQSLEKIGSYSPQPMQLRPESERQSKSALRQAQVQVLRKCRFCEIEIDVDYMCEQCQVYSCNLCRIIHYQSSPNHNITEIGSNTSNPVKLRTESVNPALVFRNCGLCLTDIKALNKCTKCQIYLCFKCNTIHQQLFHSINNIITSVSPTKRCACEIHKILLNNNSYICLKSLCVQNVFQAIEYQLLSLAHQTLILQGRLSKDSAFTSLLLTQIFKQTFENNLKFKTMLEEVEHREK